MTALPAAGTEWRFLDSGPSDGACNMAVDLALLDHARLASVATLRVYAWSRPTLSFGRHERALGRFDHARLSAAGIDVVRRPTGGRALLHHREVTYSVTAPIAGRSLAESYKHINTLLIRALSRLDVEAEMAGARSMPMRPGMAPCFAEPNAGELTVDGAKLVGSAQWRDGDALLQHGSILLADDQQRIAELTDGSVDPAGAPLRVATLEGVLGRAVSYVEVRDALSAAFSVTSTAMVQSDSGALASLEQHRLHFRDPSWTWRR